ncbi:MAG: hypothetical protein JXB10_00955, partial [Pirellulales bacterium]|nr:hypothetical protein [Pirellulales bacterium]
CAPQEFLRFTTRGKHGKIRFIRPHIVQQFEKQAIDAKHHLPTSKNIVKTRLFRITKKGEIIPRGGKKHGASYRWNVSLSMVGCSFPSSKYGIFFKAAC